MRSPFIPPIEHHADRPGIANRPQINPNGRIPAIVHHRPDGTDFTVFESAAIILYMIQRFDTEHKLSFATGSDDESEALQWIMFAVSFHLFKEYDSTILIVFRVAWRYAYAIRYI